MQPLNWHSMSVNHVLQEICFTNACLTMYLHQVMLSSYLFDEGMYLTTNHACANDVASMVSTYSASKTPAQSSIDCLSHWHWERFLCHPCEICRIVESGGDVASYTKLVHSHYLVPRIMSCIKEPCKQYAMFQAITGDWDAPCLCYAIKCWDCKINWVEMWSADLVCALLTRPLQL